LHRLTSTPHPFGRGGLRRAGGTFHVHAEASPEQPPGAALPGSPGKDTINKIVVGGGLAAEQDVVSVCVAPARAADRPDLASVVDRVRQLRTAAWTAPSPPEPARLGRPIGEWRPIDLEVHRAITEPG
jgi:hypothetical protein